MSRINVAEEPEISRLVVDAITASTKAQRASGRCAAAGKFVRSCAAADYKCTPRRIIHRRPQTFPAPSNSLPCAGVRRLAVPSLTPSGSVVVGSPP